MGNAFSKSLVGVVVLFGAAASPSSAQATDWIGREFTVNVLDEGTGDFVGREFTIFVDDRDSGAVDFAGREFTIGVRTPDLVPVQVVIPAEGNANESFNVSWQTRNSGESTALGTWTDRLTFSTPIDPVGSGAPSTIFDFTNAAGLEVGQAHGHIAGPFLFPDVEHLTTFTATITVDLGAEIVEEPETSAETNNVHGPVDITVHPIPRPDLTVVLTLQPLPGYLAGETAQIGFQVANVGSAPTSVFEWVDRVYLVPDVDQDGLPPADVSAAVASWDLESLSYLANGTGSEPGTFYDRLDVQLVLPGGALGGHFLAVVTDATFAMIEDREDNNLVFSTLITITQPPHPDLVPMNLSLDGFVLGVSELTSGQSWDLTWEVHNQGEAELAASTLVGRLYLSTNDSLDLGQLGSDLYLGQLSSPVPTIPVSGFAPRVRGVFLPVDLNLNWPPSGGLYPEDFFFKVYTDSAGTIAELDANGLERQQNNVAVSAAVIPLAPTPDLVPQAVELAPGEVPLVGHSIDVRWVVDNTGSAGWDSNEGGLSLTWKDQIWLSRDTPNPEASSEAFLLGTFSESTVQDAGGKWIIPTQIDKTRTVTIPTAVTGGSADYYLVVRTDTDSNSWPSSSSDYGDVFEYDSINDWEANNQTQSASTFQIAREPADLELVAWAQQGGSQVLPPTGGSPGEAITLPWTVTNGGAGATSVSSWTDRVWLSQDPVALVNARELLTRGHSGVLNAGESYSQVRTASVPFVSQGQWYLHFETDIGTTVFEDDLTNNVVDSLPFTVSDVVADLTVEAVGATGRMSPGDPVVVQWTVRNVGSAPTAASYWVDRVWLSDNPDLDLATETEYLGSRTQTATLAPDDTYVATKSFSVPVTLAPDSWYVVVETDSTGRVFELDETNNRGATMTQVQIDPPRPANLVARDVVGPAASVTAGQRIDLSWTVANDGLGPTNTVGWTDAIWLSRDHFIDGLDIFLGYRTHSAHIPAGLEENLDSQALGMNLSVPLWASGAYVLLVVTNSNGAVHEAGADGDNTAFAPELVEVSSPYLTDLSIEEVTIPAAAQLGEPIQITWKTRNQSQSAVPAEWSWSDDFWILPVGQIFPSPDARLLGQYVNPAGQIDGGALDGPLDTGLLPEGSPSIPGLLPGDYRIIARSDVQNQINEAEEGLVETPPFNDNVTAAGTITLSAIALDPIDTELVSLPSDSSRWFHLTTPAEATIHLELLHDDDQGDGAACELYVRADDIPTPGLFDLASEGIGSSTPYLQELTIPRALPGVDYYVLARTVGEVAPGATDATVTTSVRDFQVEDVLPTTVGTGTVTFAATGGELWKATRWLLREQGGGAVVADGLGSSVTADGELLALFDLAGVPHADYELVLVDELPEPDVESVWSGLVTVEEAEPLALGLSLSASPNVRKGNAGRATLRFENEGNVNLPFAAATLGHRRPSGATAPDDRIVVSSQQLDLAEVETDGERDSLVLFIEDLGPSQVYELDLELAVGGQWSAEVELPDIAAFATSGTPWSADDFLEIGGFFQALSGELRRAVADHQDTHSQLAAIANDAPTWRGHVSAALANGGLVVDATTIHLPTDEARTARQLLDAIAQAVFVDAGLPAGAEVPPGAIDAVASGAGCVPFPPAAFDCEELFPAGCEGESAEDEVSIVAGANVPTASVCIATPEPNDPNQKIKPLGVGSQSMVNAYQPLTYRIHYENLAGAGAWASRVEITDPLEVEYRGASLRLHTLRIGQTELEMPPNTGSFQHQVLLQVNEETESLVQISAGLDAQTRTVFLTMQALDPETGLPPISGDAGFLPPNDQAFEGQATGYLEFSVRADVEYLGCDQGGPQPESSPSGTRMRNRARVRFNQSAPLVTDETENTLDGGAPVSGFSTLGPPVGRSVPLEWFGSDTELLCGVPFDGAGVASYTLSASSAGPDGPWMAVLSDTQATSHTFVGDIGVQRYWFKIEAKDRVGNIEAKDTADSEVRIPLLPAGPMRK